jgi:methyl-accepting chemotaxis protein/NO-binding membrane sensor protein with MHYT domain
MYRIVACLTEQHDYGMVALAITVCALASATAFKTYGHALDASHDRKLVWLMLAGFSAGAGIWATHFIAMLAYDSGVPTNYDLSLTGASLLIASVMTMLGFAVSATGIRPHAIAGGTIVGFGIAAMHYTGMAALVIGGTIKWDMTYVAASLVAGTVLTAEAIDVFHRLPRAKALWASTALMVLGICILHFTAVTAAVVELNPKIVVQPSTVNRVMLAFIIASVTLLVLVAGGLAMFIDTLKAEMAEQVLKLKRADISVTSAKAEAEALSELAETERAFHDELARLVLAASGGDFTGRIDLSGKSGLPALLGTGINRWAGTINDALNQIISVTSAMAEGDFTKRAAGQFKGDFLKLMTNVNRMGDEIRGTADRIGQSSAALEEAAREINIGVADLSERTEEQAIALEKTAESMQQMSAAVVQNASNAQNANDIASKTRDLAIDGGYDASQAVLAMDKIEQSSRRITEIVGLIEEIAFQTNILSLNAAVEAARAGESGRGFAVVASEVRALSQRSSLALNDIRQLIATSNSDVQDGVRMVKTSGASLSEIVDHVKKVSELISEIAVSSQQQSTGVEQVISSVNKMDELTQSNAALVEETSAALDSVLAQAEDLRMAVSFFKTGSPEKLEIPRFPVGYPNPARSQRARR